MSPRQYTCACAGFGMRLVAFLEGAYIEARLFLMYQCHLLRRPGGSCQKADER